ncbi:hypothetical protein D9619_006852 [Psilocybe cf. subviscida]|uniref:Uncharacterized protein n=1 Tax=Psilocybe cf. subviscida TaxID=2480587 RepID=A0A8H5EXS6_9AGAR|nr:hypothetical protein D9619_006852 [Psilocybe cf. subviscida]
MWSHLTAVKKCLDYSHSVSHAPLVESHSLPTTILCKTRRIARRFVSTPTSPVVTTSPETAFTCVDYFCISNEPVDNDPPQRGARVLDIDLRLPYGHGIPQKTIYALDRRVERRLTEIVADDNKKEPEKRFDAMRTNAAGPSKEMWTTFKDLNPRHLSIIGGWSEECYFEPLQLMTKWDRLESIYLGGICSTGEVYHLPPFVLRTLKSLDLHMCLSMGIRAVGEAAHMLQLENLNLHTNDSLRCLSIKSSFFGYDYEEERTGIRRILTECTKLTDVKLSLRLHHAVYIAGFLPPAIQRIEFAVERSMASLPLIDDWIVRAKDPKWAPNLRFLKFTVDREGLSMPKRFFLTEICGEDEEAGQTYTPGATVTLPGEEVDFGSSVSGDQDPVFDEDTFDSYVQGVWSTEAHVTDDSDKIDLDNLPGIGPHPNHVTNKELEADNASWRRKQKAMSVGDEALAEFEEAFAAKKEELFKTLRDTRPGIELV